MSDLQSDDDGRLQRSLDALSALAVNAPAIFDPHQEGAVKFIIRQLFKRAVSAVQHGVCDRASCFLLSLSSSGWCDLVRAGGWMRVEMGCHACSASPAPHLHESWQPTMLQGKRTEDPLLRQCSVWCMSACHVMCYNTIVS